MARTFDGVNDQIAYGSEAAIDDLMGFTACAYLYTTSNVTAEQSIVAKCKSDYAAMELFISATGSGGNNNKVFLYVHTNDYGPYAESVANTLVLNTWQIVVTTWVGTVGVTAPKIYVGTVGGVIAEPSYAVSRAGTGSYQSSASASLRLGTRDPLDTFYGGGLAEAAIWNRVLTAGEIAALGRGFAPAFFPRGRVFYSPLAGRQSTEPNWAGTTHGTVTGATYLEHPRVIYPAHVGPRLFKSGTPPSTAVPVFVHQLRQQGIC